MIGVFDSGFGGLTVLKEFLRLLPQYDYIYLGDNARAPYGNKSDEVIYSYTKEAVDFLFKQGCELIIIACHTSSAKALRRIQQEYLPIHNPGKRVLGVVVPMVEEAVKLSRFHRLGIIGTKATIESQVYEKELKKNWNLSGSARSGVAREIHSRSCPLLVPLVEEGWIGKPETRLILKKYLRPLKLKKIDTLILGCTHYPLLIKDLARLTGKRVKIVDPGKVVAEKLKDYLERHKEIEEKLSKHGRVVFYTTDDTNKFKQLGEKFLGQTIKQVEKVNL